MIVEIPSLSRHVYLITIYGTRLLVIHDQNSTDERFSRGESAVLPLLDKNDGGTERRSLFKY